MHSTYEKVESNVGAATVNQRSQNVRFDLHARLLSKAVDREEKESGNDDTSIRRQKFMSSADVLPSLSFSPAP